MHKRASGLEKLTRQEVGYEVGAVLFIASLMAQWVKNLPAMQETQVLSLGWEDALEEEDGNPFQYSCLKNLIDRGAWWATIHGVAKSRT